MIKIDIELPKEVNWILDKIQESGKEAFVVGGCVRDSLLGLKPKDWDICTSAIPSEVLDIFKKEEINITTIGIQFGTVELIVNGETYEVTTYRTDGQYTDGRKPSKVVFETLLEKDILRRDLTINGLAYNHKLKLVDFVGGYQDLKNKKIKFIGDTRSRLMEDHLRALRALRFELSLDGFTLEDETRELIHQDFKLHHTKISYERIRSEINKILLCNTNDLEKLTDFFKLMAKTSMPELQGIVDLDQRNIHHKYDVLRHSVSAIINAENLLEVKWAALLHDTGKSDTMTIDENGNGHFYGHNEFSTIKAEQILDRFKFDNKFKKQVIFLVDKHGRISAQSRDMTIKKLISEYGSLYIRNLLLLMEADLMAHNYTEKSVLEFEEVKRRIIDILKSKTAITIKELNINGNDLLKIVDIKDRKYISRILNTLLVFCLNDIKLNNKDWLLDRAKKEYSNIVKDK